MGIAHPPGYPLFTMLAWLLHKVPVGSPAWRINLLSVLLATASAWLYSCPLYSCPLYVAVWVQLDALLPCTQALHLLLCTLIALSCVMCCAVP
jgi:hypothetical protein